MATNQIANAVLDVSQPRHAISELTGRLSGVFETITAFFLFLFALVCLISILYHHLLLAEAT